MLTAVLAFAANCGLYAVLLLVERAFRAGARSDVLAVGVLLSQLNAFVVAAAMVRRAAEAAAERTARERGGRRSGTS